MKMGKKVKEYKAGDFIFAKVKGYPAWPARVQRPNGKKYFVYFYGTGETANLPPNMIFDYAENKDKFLSKAVKRRDFNDGVKQIEHDFANNVPLEQVIGVPMEMPEESANDTANDSAINDTIDDSTADTTAAADDTTVADESAVNTTAPATSEPAVEDSDEAGALVIDEGKKANRKPSTAAKPTGKETPKPVKEPKTPRGKKKDEDESKEEDKKEDKKDEEIVSRSGRKIRPKRYIDEQTEENATLPSPAIKKRRGGSPAQDKDESKTEKADAKGKSGKQYNAVTQAELEDMKEPFQPEDPEKENILIAYLPHGQYVGVQIFQSRPASFNSEAARLQWDKQQVHNAIALKQQLEKSQITAQSVMTQLVTDLNLTDEEKATLDKERETEEKKSRVQFLKTEMKLIELEAKIKTCLCLEKADTEMCLKLLDEFMELEIKPLMLLKHPSCGETVKRLRAYVGNTPSWELSESAALQFAQQAHLIRKRADALYRRVKDLFTVPEGLTFWEFFSERVVQFKKVTAKLTPDELLELVHIPLEMSMPTSHTMRASVEAANDDDLLEEDIPKKKPAAKPRTKHTNNSTPSKTALKRQSSRKQPEEKEKEKANDTEQNSVQEKSDNAAAVEKTSSKDSEKNEDEKNSMETEHTAEVTTNNKEDTNNEDTLDDNTNKDTLADKTDSNKDKADTDDKPKDDLSEKVQAKDDSDKTNNKNKDDSVKTSSKTKDDSEKPNSTNKDGSDKANKNKTSSNKDKSKSNSPSPNEKEVDNVKSTKDTKKDTKEDKAVKEEKAEKPKEEKTVKEEKTDRADEKEKDDEPRAKRSRDSKKTDAPPPRSPIKRKTKY